MKIFDALHAQLRTGDFVLVNDPPHEKPVAAEVIKCTSYGGLAIRFSDGRERYFTNRSGFADILAGARKVDDQYIPL